MSTWKASIAVCGALAIAVVTSTSASAAGPNPGDRPFVVSGSVNGLYPGGTTVLNVLVENPNDVELDLTLLSGAVSSSSSGCDQSYVVFDGFSGRQRVAATSSITMPINVRMLPSAPDSCQGVTFALNFTGEGIADPLNTRATKTTTAIAEPDKGQPPDGPLARTGLSPFTRPAATLGFGLTLSGIIAVIVSRRNRKKGAR